MNDLMKKEIDAQSAYVELCLPLLRENLNTLDLTCNRVIMGGCGDSYFSALSLTNLFNKYGINFLGTTSQEIEQFTGITNNDLVVFASVSGSTKRTIKAAEKAKKQRAKTLAITCNPESTLSKICDHTLVLPYKPITRETPHTLDFIITLLAQVLLIENLTGKIFSDLDKLSVLINETIRIASDKIESLCTDIIGEPRVFFLAAGGKSGTAMYGAAKLHEAGGLVAINCEPENFWHGQNFMVRQNDFVVLFGNENEELEVEKLLLKTLSQLTKNVIYVGSDRVNMDFNVNPKISSDVIIPFTDSIAPQLLCFHISNALSIEVEKATRRLAVNSHSVKSQSIWYAQ